ncbi:MAG: hypothetical protein M1827_001548 [Pycnora praestabilis]|nr:MAG: hypothetical protein M1827_001548 [Pycnora praestabilis]
MTQNNRAINAYHDFITEMGDKILSYDRTNAGEVAKNSDLRYVISNQATRPDGRKFYQAKILVNGATKISTLKSMARGSSVAGSVWIEVGASPSIEEIGDAFKASWDGKSGPDGAPQTEYIEKE